MKTLRFHPGNWRRHACVCGVAVVTTMLAAGAASGADVSGRACLEGRSIHCLTKVDIDNGNVHPARYTDIDCDFGPWIGVLPGWHTFDYAHCGYYPETHEFYVPFGGGELPLVILPTKGLCNPSQWEEYPHAIPGSSITIPYDDGRHDPTSANRVEWWYVNLHLTDEDGRDYAGMVSFLKPPVVGMRGMVLCSVIDLEVGIPCQDAKRPVLFSAQDDFFEISAGAPPADQWFNRDCEGQFLEFETHLSTSWLACGGICWLELDLKALKPPLAVGGDGSVEFGGGMGAECYAYTNVDVCGTLHLPGFPPLGKAVEGKAWVDHLWSDFPDDTVSWERLTIQLDDQREILVGDAWVGGAWTGRFTGGLNEYEPDCDVEVAEAFRMKPMSTWTDPETGWEFVTQWRVTTEPARDINLVVTARFDHQMMELTDGIILPLSFWEGSCTVTGTIDGDEVQGDAFAECTRVCDLFDKRNCPGNTNGDDEVDVDDLNNVILDWGTPGTHGGDVTGPIPFSPPDGAVDVNDLQAVIGGWGACEGAVVKE